MRILLVQPADPSGPVGFRVVALPEPLALECLAATVPDHEVAILDMRLEPDLAAALARFVPDVVAVTALTTEVYAAQEVLRTAKAHAAEIITVVGGHHATLLPEDFYRPCVDAIGLGDGELVFPQLIAALAAGRTLASVPNLAWRNADGQFVHNGRTVAAGEMDCLPLPRRDLVEKYRAQYFFLFDKPDVSVVTSRGCPHRCHFCSVWQFYGGQTCQMSPQRVVEHIQAVDNEHVTFMDDNFLADHRRGLRIVELIRAAGISRRYAMQCRSDSVVRHPELVEKWVDAGLRLALVGLEGGADEMLQRVNKHTTAAVNDEAVRILHANGVIIWGAFLVDPDWTAEHFAALRDYVTRQRITHTQFTILTPLPGTQWYRQVYDQLLTHDYACYDNLHAVLPTRLPREEFYRQFAWLYRPRSLSVYYDLVQQGILSIEDCRMGKEMLQTFSNWQLYLENDPILARQRASNGGMTPIGASG
jgi:radical SAM superfamily enzyme YgiQ (UPF0313 family)